MTLFIILPARLRGKFREKSSRKTSET